MSELPDPPSDTFHHTWDTAYVAPKDRFAYFREGVCQTSLAITAEDPGEHAIEARMGCIDLPQGIINRIDISPLRVVRTPTDLAKINDEFLALTFQLTGNSRRLLAGQEYFEGPGDANLIDCNLPIEVSALGADGWTSTNLIVKKTLITDQVPFDGILQIKGPPLAIIRSCIDLINERYREGSRQELAALFNASVSLLLATLVKDRDLLEDCCAQNRSTQVGILQAIKAYVRKELPDPTLSTLSVAGHFGISPRYLQKLFANERLSFKPFVVNTRLDRVHAALLDPYNERVPSSEIAFRSGFRDLTTFHRNFKRRFGDTPAQVRKIEAPL